MQLYGGPGSGKSTTLHFLAWQFKIRNYPVDVAREWIKRFAFYNKPVDQLRVLSEQLREERDALATGAIVISDSPIFLQAAYTEGPLQALTIERAKELEAEYPAVHVFIDRDDRVFDQRGRWGDLEAARAKDAVIQNVLWDHSPHKVYSFGYGQWDQLWKYVSTEMGMPVEERELRPLSTSTST